MITTSSTSPTQISGQAGRVDATKQPFITEEHQNFYQDNGYLVVENALDTKEVAELNRDAVAICRGHYGHYKGWLGPHDGQSDDEVLTQYLCIHFPHKFSTKMYRYLSSDAMVETLTHVIGPNVKCMQSMLFIKSAGKPGQAWHQDEFYIPTRDRSLTGGWIALDDATVDNGCLWVIPGSHKHGILWPQHEHEDKRFDCSGEAVQFPYTDDDAVAVEVKAGSIVFFNGYLLHRSLPNTQTTGYRRCLVNHYMSAESLLPWYGQEIKGQDSVATADYRDIVMVAGEDPYDFKGLEKIATPHVRPSGEGGCAKYGGEEK